MIVSMIGTRLVREARAAGHCNLHWRVGRDVQREFYLECVRGPDLTPDDIRALASLTALTGDFIFCGLPAFIDNAAPVMQVTLMRSDEIASEQVVK